MTAAVFKNKSSYTKSTRRTQSIPVTWGVLGWKAFLNECREVGHVLVLLTGNELWVRQIAFPRKPPAHPLKHIVAKNFKVPTTSIGWKQSNVFF